MAERTTNYGLIKPSENDFYNIEEFNSNSDAIDKALSIAQTTADTAQVTANAAKVDEYGAFMDERTTATTGILA